MYSSHYYVIATLSSTVKGGFHAKQSWHLREHVHVSVCALQERIKKTFVFLCALVTGIAFVLGLKVLRCLVIMLPFPRDSHIYNMSKFREPVLNVWA